MFVCRGVLAVAALACLAYGVNGCGDFQNLHTIDPSEITTLKSENFDTLNLLGPTTCIAVLSSATPVRMWVHDVTVSPTDTIQLSYTDGGTQVVDLVALWTSGDSILIAPQETTFSVVLSVTSVTVPSRLAMSFVGTSPIPACSSQLQPTSIPAYLELPSFPSSYQQNSNCYWEMTTVFDFIRFEIQWLDLDQLAGACGENLFITNGLYGAQSFGNIANLCEDRQLYMENAMTFRSSGNQANVFFSADNNNIVGTGFRIRYWAESDPVNTEPTVSHTCDYNSDQTSVDYGKLRLTATVKPGTNGVSRVYPVNRFGDFYDKLDGDCGHLTSPNSGDLWVVDQYVSYNDPSITYVNSFGVQSCPLTHETIDGVVSVVLRILVMRFPAIVTRYDYVYSIHCSTIPAAIQPIQTGDATVVVADPVLPEYGALDPTPTLRLDIIEKYTYAAPLSPTDIATEVRLMFTLNNPTAISPSSIIAGRVHSCEVSSSRDYTDIYTMGIIDIDGCPEVYGEGYPLIPDAGFLGDPNAPGYDVDLAVSGINYVSVSGVLPLGLFDTDPQVSTLYFRCAVTTCNVQTFASCSLDNCNRGRKRRSADSNSNTTDTEVQGVILIDDLPFRIFHEKENQGMTPDAVESKDCLDNWIFLAVVCVLSVLIVVAIFISFCLFYMIKQNR